MHHCNNVWKITFPVVTLSVLCATSVAHAYNFKEFPVNDCIPSRYSPGTIIFNVDNQMSNGAADVLSLYCPLFGGTTDDLGPQNAYGLYLYGFKNYISGPGADILASACRFYDSGTGGSCGGQSSQSISGSFTLSISDLSAWNVGGNNDAYFLTVLIPPMYEDSYNVIWSYSFRAE